MTDTMIDEQAFTLTQAAKVVRRKNEKGVWSSVSRKTLQRRLENDMFPRAYRSAGPNGEDGTGPWMIPLGDLLAEGFTPDPAAADTAESASEPAASDLTIVEEPTIEHDPAPVIEPTIEPAPSIEASRQADPTTEPAPDLAMSWSERVQAATGTDPIRPALRRLPDDPPDPAEGRRLYAPLDDDAPPVAASATTGVFFEIDNPRRRGDDPADVDDDAAYTSPFDNDVEALKARAVDAENALADERTKRAVAEALAKERDARVSDLRAVIAMTSRALPAGEPTIEPIGDAAVEVDPDHPAVGADLIDDGERDPEGTTVDQTVMDSFYGPEGLDVGQLKPGWFLFLIAAAIAVLSLPVALAVILIG